MNSLGIPHLGGVPIFIFGITSFFHISRGYRTEVYMNRGAALLWYINFSMISNIIIKVDITNPTSGSEAIVYSLFLLLLSFNRI